MRKVKCRWCGNESEKDSMVFTERKTGKYLKSGKEKVDKKYYHRQCYELYLKDQEFKEKEAYELSQLYEYLCKLHNLEALDGRMMERIQDLRNGTIKVGTKKFKKYKSGVPYTAMLETYQHIESKLENIRMYKTDLQTEWNVFTYFFGTMVNSLVEVQNTLKNVQHQKQIHKERVSNNKDLHQTNDIKVKSKLNKKKDELDISNYL